MHSQRCKDFLGGWWKVPCWILAGWLVFIFRFADRNVIYSYFRVDHSIWYQSCGIELAGSFQKNLEPNPSHLKCNDDKPNFDDPLYLKLVNIV